MLAAAARGARALTEESVARVAEFVLGRLNSDGGFRGRTADSDLYYSVFGIECLLALGRDEPAPRVGRYLGRFGDGEALDFVHLACLARCRARVPGRTAAQDADRALLQRIEGSRSGDGGYGTVPNARHGAVYACFLAWLAYEDLGAVPPAPSGLAACLESLRTADGAFANEPGLQEGTTTATAAAAVLLPRIGAGTPPGLGEWLLRQGCAQGGFRANPGAPLPDLLSTATALQALAVVGADIAAVRADCLAFVESLWHEDGGFCGHCADRTSDCEYTFYALLALGRLLAPPGSDSSQRPAAPDI